MVKIIKKPDMAPRQETLLRIGAVLLALAASAVVIALIGYNPFQVFAKIVEGSLMSLYRVRETISKAIPLVVLSLGVAVAFKMKFWNIGAEGQIYMGAFGAALVAFSGAGLPSPLLLALMLLVGAALGGLWALIPAFLKLRFSASETLVTLMLNYVAQEWVSYLQHGPWKDPKAIGFPKIAQFAASATLPKVLGIHIGWIIALIMVVLVHILLNKSKLGFEISVLGESETTARYAGMNVAKTVVIAVMISGGLCGMAGMLQAAGVEHTLNDQLSGGLGFTAVITSWLARLSAPAIVVVSFLFSVLLQGGTYLQSSLQIPATVADVLQAIILFFVLGSEFFIQYSVVFSKKAGKEAGRA